MSNTLYGYFGKQLRVSLSTGEIKSENIDVDILRKYIGGVGYGARVLYDELEKGIDPLSPDNKIIFATSPLTANNIPGGGSIMVCFKSPLTQIWGESRSGGNFGPDLRKTGYDALIISGKSSEQVYISIRDGKVEIKPAANLWGKDTKAVTEMLRTQEGENASSICIGPAGENNALISCIMNDGCRALARGGCGAVMGSKNLKAIVAQGGGRPTIADEERMKFFTYEANKLLRAHPMTSKGLPELGPAGLFRPRLPKQFVLPTPCSSSVQEASQLNRSQRETGAFRSSALAHIADAKSRALSDSYRVVPRLQPERHRCPVPASM